MGEVIWDADAYVYGDGDRQDGREKKKWYSLGTRTLKRNHSSCSGRRVGRWSTGATGAVGD